jgi:hypothetical protein
MREVLAVTVNQCSILYVHDGNMHDAPVEGLKTLGFAVMLLEDFPPDETLASHHAVVLRARPGCSLPMLAARIRAKARFGRRVLIALVPDETPVRARREAVLSGFDATLSVSCSARELAASILKLLRSYPEFRCFLRSPTGRRKAA